MSGLKLYHYEGCGYCYKVRRVLDDLDIEVAEVDIRRVPEARRELLDATGRTRVPVLRIDDADGRRWLPESNDIIAYLRGRCGKPDPQKFFPFIACVIATTALIAYLAL